MMLIANSSVAPAIPGLATDFNLLTQDDGGPFNWHHSVAQYIASSCTVQHSYTVDYPYLSSYTATFTPHTPVPLAGLGSLYYASGVAEYQYNIGPWPPGATVETRLVGGGEVVFDRDLVALGTNYITQGQTAEESALFADTYYYGLPYHTADVEPGKTPPQFSFTSRVKSVRKGGHLYQINSPIYGSIVTPQDTIAPWMKWYQVYTDELKYGHAIDGLPDGDARYLKTIDFGDGGTFFAPTSPQKGVVYCELLDDALSDRVTVHYRNIHLGGGSKVSTCVLDLADPTQPRYVEARSYTYGGRLHAATDYYGLYDLAERPVIAIGAGGYGTSPQYPLPPTMKNYWKLHDFYTGWMSYPKGGGRQSYWNKRPSQIIRISLAETDFDWATGQ